MNEWLANLRVSDPVVILSSGLGGDFISKVERLTKTQIIVARGGKFRRSDGEAVGGGVGYHRSILVEPTQEVTDRIQHNILANRLTRFEWKSLSIHNLRRIAALLATLD